MGLVTVRTAWLLLLLTLLVLLASTRFWPTVERVEVSGQERYDRLDVMRLAQVAPGDPLLWVTRWRVAGLDRDPWIARARVIRHWPDTVSIRVWEREPLAYDGTTAYAPDGTVLPLPSGVTPPDAVQVSGWGVPRLDGALELARLLRSFDPEVIQYSPEGFEITLADTVLFTPDVASVRRHWAAIESQRGGRLAVYPWGVSKAHE